MCWSGHRDERFDDRHEGRAPDRVAPEMRASDADRQWVIDQLRVHTADGRLSLEEFEARVGEAWSATTHGELGLVLRELPARAPAVSRRRARRAGVGLPAPLLIALVVLAGSLLMGHFAWWLIPVGFWMVGGCGGHRSRSVEQRAVGSDEQLTSA